MPRQNRKPPRLGAVSIAGRRLDAVAIPVGGFGPGVTEATVPPRQIRAKLADDLLELRLPTPLVVVMYFEGMLPVDRTQAIAIAFARAKADDYWLTALELGLDEHGNEITTLRFRRADALPANVLPFAGSHAAHEWLFGVTELPREVAGDEGLFRPMIMTFLDPHTGHLFPPQLGPSVDAELIAAAWRDALAVGLPRPARVRVASTELAAQIRRAIPGLDVIVAPTPEFDGPWSELTAVMADEVAPTYVDEGRVPLDRVEEFFTAALEYRRTKPWANLARFVGLRAEIREWDLRVVVSTVRDNGLGGMGVHLDVDAFEASYAAFEPGAPTTPVDFLAVVFYGKRDLPDPLREELAGFEFARTTGPYPALLCVDGDGGRRAPNLGEYELAIVLLQVLPRYAKRMRDGSYMAKLAGREVQVELELIDADGGIPF